MLPSAPSERGLPRERVEEPAKQKVLCLFLKSNNFLVAHSPSGGTPPALDVLLAKLDRCLQHDSRKEPFMCSAQDDLLE